MNQFTNYNNFEREQKVRAQQYWVSILNLNVSNPLPPTVANRFNHTFTNPVGSGKNIFVTRIDVSSSVGANYPSIYRNPTGNLPTTVQLYLNADLSVVTAPVAVLKADISAQTAQGAGAFTGGTLIGYSHGPGALLGGSYEKSLSPFLVPPGTSFGVTSQYLNAIILWVAFEWWEEPI